MTTDSRSRTLLVISQVFVPDPASVGQHMFDAAAEMRRRGYRVVVLTADRGYDDPAVRYKPRETIAGVEIRRLPFSSFGKRSIGLRLLGAASFLGQCVVRGLFTRSLSRLLVSTSPPLCPLIALVIGGLRRVPVKYWVMDLNPDQMVRMGWMKPSSLQVRLFDRVNRMILRRAADVIVLDRFMAERTLRKLDVRHKISVTPPWPHEDHLEIVPHEDNPFRRRHGLDGKFVIMYSGNHSPVHPVRTLLDAALRLADEPRLVFMFIGGGLGKKEIDETIERHRTANIVSLPYQPLADLKYSLSAADVHVASMGNAMVGVVHPCKIYGAMAVARPILLLGPTPCHASEIIEEHSIGWCVAHGDTDGAAEVIRNMLQTEPGVLAEMGCRARQVINTRLSKRELCGRFCDVIEGAEPTTIV